MTPKEYLIQYSRLVERIRQLDEDIAKLEEEIGGTGTKNDGMPRGTKISDPTASFAVQLAEKKARKLEIRAKAWEKRDEIQAVIDSIEDPVSARLLYERYILRMRWRDIAEGLGYELNYTTMRLHTKALAAVAEKMTVKEGYSV